MQSSSVQLQGLRSTTHHMSICPQWIVIGYLLGIFALLFFLKKVFIYIYLKHSFSILDYDCKYDWNFICVYILITWIWIYQKFQNIFLLKYVH